MASDPQDRAAAPKANKRSGSTTYGWRKVKITEPPAGPTENGVVDASLRSRARKDRREWLTIRVRYRGGAETWWWIKARGVDVKRPGHLALHDVLSELYAGNGRVDDI